MSIHVTSAGTLVAAEQRLTVVACFSAANSLLRPDTVSLLSPAHCLGIHGTLSVFPLPGSQPPSLPDLAGARPDRTAASLPSRGNAPCIFGPILIAPTRVSAIPATFLMRRSFSITKSHPHSIPHQRSLQAARHVRGPSIRRDWYLRPPSFLAVTTVRRSRPSH